MIRGTTPTLEFMLPFETDSLSALFITLAQNNTTALEKSKSDCTCEGKKVSVTLTQAETLSLTANIKTEIQIRCKTSAGEVLASDIILVSTDRILKDGAI